MTKVDLSNYSNREDVPDGYRYGRSVPVRFLWYFVSVFIFKSHWLPVSGIKVRLLRLFGARVGEGVLIKPGVTINQPWYLEIGDHTWIGERAWLEVMGATMSIGSHVVISQNCFICTGSHDWEDPIMGGIARPVVIEDGAWICSSGKVFHSVTVGEEAIVTPGTIVTKDLEPHGIYRGNPAEKIGVRTIRDYPGPKRAEERPMAAVANG